MFHFYPAATITLQSRHTPLAFIDRLAQLVEQPRGFRWTFSKHLDFEGELGTGGFSIMRINRIGRRTQVLVQGHVGATQAGCTIQLTYSLDKGAYFQILWAVALLALSRRTALADPALRNRAIVTIGIALIVALAVQIFLFNREIGKVEELLLDLES